MEGEVDQPGMEIIDEIPDVVPSRGWKALDWRRIRALRDEDAHIGVEREASDAA
jgi:hypothetical protein